MLVNFMLEVVEETHLSLLCLLPRYSNNLFSPN
jgi:hypothetical protein